jgi:hypothetical protein
MAEAGAPPAIDLAPPDSLFSSLRAAAGTDWRAYTDHAFTRATSW